MLRLSLAALLILAGCSFARTADPVTTTLNYVTTVPAAAALDSVRVWAESLEGVTTDLGGSSLAIVDARPATAGRTVVDAVSRIDGLTQMTLRTEHPPDGGSPVAMAWHSQIQLTPEVLFLPATGSDPVCRSVADWRNDLARRSEAPRPADPSAEPVEVDERAPELIGGLAGLGVRYPEAMRRAGIQARVVVQFVVSEYGDVECAEPILSPHPQFSEAALVAVRRARFVPGMQRGRAVRVRFSLPITFRLR